LAHRGLTGQVIGLAIKVYQTIGPSLLEAVDCECLAGEAHEAAIPFQREVAVPYKGKTLPLGFPADSLAGRCILIEIEALSAILTVHETQLLTYLRLRRIPVGSAYEFPCRAAKGRTSALSV